MVSTAELLVIRFEIIGQKGFFPSYTSTANKTVFIKKKKKKSGMVS